MYDIIKKYSRLLNKKDFYMDYRRFESMTTAVPNLFRNAGVSRYGGSSKQERNKDDRSLPRRQDVQVRPCLSGSSICEFKFDKKLFRMIEVVKQINDNFIAAVALSENNKVLILMDQHAIHERIRYENLLKDYTIENRTLCLPVDLDIPIVIHDLPKYIYEQLLANTEEVKRSGMRIMSGKSGSLIIKSIPKCYDRKQFRQSPVELTCIIRKLLIEMTNDWESNHSLDTSIPMFIHCTIATEACHGAIKFGEKLDIDQCTKLVRALMYTKAPSRCAHGRPSVIPLLELDVSKNKTSISKKKLNFASLKRLKNSRKS